MNRYIKIAKVTLASFAFLVVGCDDIENDNPNTPPSDLALLENNDYERRALDLTYGAYSATQLQGCMGYDFTSGAAWLSEAASEPDTQAFVQSATTFTNGLYDNTDPYALSIYRDTYILINRANNLLATVDELLKRRINNLQGDQRNLATGSDELRDSQITEDDIVIDISDFSFNNIDLDNISGVSENVIQTLFPDSEYRGNPSRLALFRGQALFLRALGLFWATNTFNLGNVPMPLKVPTTIADSKLPLTPRAQVFEQIIRDLKLAKNLYLSNFKSRPDNLASLATWGAATALLGKVYLYNEQFEEAAVAFKEVIDCPECGYALLTDDLDRNFNEAGEFNSESIFEVAFLLNKPLFNGFGSGEGNRQAESTRRGVIFGARAGGGLQWARPSHFITNLYKNEYRSPEDENETETIHILYRESRNTAINEDTHRTTSIDGARRLLSKRAKSSLFFEDDLQRLYNGTTRESFQQYGGIFNHSPVRATVKKFTDWEQAQQPQTSGINERVIRFSDVKLMYAEALLRQGAPNTAEAVLQINDVRRARGLVDLEVLFAGKEVPPVAELYGLELDEEYADFIHQENVDRIKNNTGEIIPFELDRLFAEVLNGTVILDEGSSSTSEVDRLNTLRAAGEVASLHLDWNRVGATAQDPLGATDPPFPVNLLIEEKSISNPDDILEHLFNKERPAEFAFEGHGILYNDLRRRPGGAFARLEELSQYMYLGITPDATLGNGEVASNFQALDVGNNRETFFQDFAVRVRNIRGSRLKENLYLPIPLTALEENDNLSSNPELLIRD